MHGDTWFGHPRALSTLFFTEMWERFSYYGMRAILVLFMVAPNGLAFSTAKAASIYGLYTMMVYAACIPGGLIADRYLGHYRSVLSGGIIIALGHFSMAIPRIETFFLGLGLIIIGTGLLKPNVSSMVGMLYTDDDARRDAGFSLFYMGINVGATLSPLVCGWLGQRVNWHAGFAAAGVGMLLGLTQYVLGRKRLPKSVPTTQRVRSSINTPKQPITRDEWKRIAAIGVFFFFSILFFGAFEQAGSTLTLFADRMTRLSIFGRSFPSSWFQSEQPLFVICLSPFFAWLWVRLGKREPSAVVKFSIGLFLVGFGFLVCVPAARAAQLHGQLASPVWLTLLYLIHTFGELCLSPVGLSLVTKLSPPRLVGLMMGVWFLGSSFGDYIAGTIAALLEVIPFYQLFGGVFVVTTIASGAALLLRKPMRRLASGEPEGAAEARLAA